MTASTSIVLHSTKNSEFVKGSLREESPQTGTFRTPDCNLAALLIVAKHGLPFCGTERNDNGDVVYTFEDVRHEGVRLAHRWAEARTRLRRAAHAAHRNI